MNEIRALTGIRGVAALTVFLGHTRQALEGRGVELPVSVLGQRLFLSGGRQVDIFFVLSGFILALIYEPWFDKGVARDSYLKFIRKRFARIYPLQVFMLTLIGGCVLAASWLHIHLMNGLGRFSISTLVQNYLLVQAWGFAGKDGGPWNPPSWSISVEALAYLLFPFFLWLTTGARRHHRWALLAASIAFGFVCNALLFWGEIGIEGIGRGLCEFALGNILASFFRSDVADWLRSNAGSSAAFALLVICFALTPDTGFVIALCVAPLLLALSGRNPVSAVFGSAPVYFLGEISYSIYLGHFLFTSLTYRVISTDWMKTGPIQTAVGIAGIIAIVIGLSTATYFLIERPGRDWLGGRRKTIPGAQTPETPAAGNELAR